jgi:Domain of unknown function(DUF2779)
MRPYEQVAFQWSCHTIREKDGNLEHTEWINVVDAFPNFAFAEALMEQMRRYRYSNVRLERWLDLITKRDDNPSPFIIDMCALAKDGYFHPKMKGKALSQIRAACGLGEQRRTSHRSRICKVLQTRAGWNGRESI